MANYSLHSLARILNSCNMLESRLNSRLLTFKTPSSRNNQTVLWYTSALDQHVRSFYLKGPPLSDCSLYNLTNPHDKQPKCSVRIVASTRLTAIAPFAALVLRFVSPRFVLVYRGQIFRKLSSNFTYENGMDCKYQICWEDSRIISKTNSREMCSKFQWGNLCSSLDRGRRFAFKNDPFISLNSSTLLALA